MTSTLITKLNSLKIDNSYSDEKKKAILLVTGGGSKFQNLSEEMRADRDVILAAVKHYCKSLAWAPEYAKDDEEIVLASSALYDFDNFEIASDRLKTNKNFIVAAAEKDGNILRYVDGYTRQDKYFMFPLIKNNIWAFRWAGDNLKADRECAVAAIRRYSGNLAYVSVDFRDDREIVKLAVSDNGWALHHASTRLKDDKDIVLEAVRSNGNGLVHASYRLRGDREVVYAAINENVMAHQYVVGDLYWDQGVFDLAEGQDQKD